ncbi:MAG TPA: dTDP-4-dehydrorhamnose 3,5-epimerase [Stellaceae bacterium]|jgi:dTDP-4-dehydrorhamnose 3,5-epimerase|nr:dTDP-4-dehydrorhamnose 3,5-epimerase [Stellaceae bacterium]
MQITSTAIADVKLIARERHGDARGFFAELYRLDALREAGIETEFVQDNQAFSAAVNIVRGLHFQTAPAAQAKLLRVAAGVILDVAVDLRRRSPTYGRHVAIELSAEAGTQIYIPEGFAHGYRTLTPNTEVIYKVNRYYSPDHDRGVRWDDPALGIDWGVSADAAVLSDKDRRQPLFAELPPLFER